MKNIFLLLFLAHISFANYTEVYKEFTEQNAKLYSSLFKQYIKELSPSYSLGSANAPVDYEPVPVNLNLNYFRVNKVDQVSQSAEVVVSMGVIWVDRRLVWNETDNGQIPYILVKRRVHLDQTTNKNYSDTLWQPNITPCDAQSRENVDDDKTTMAKVYSNGTVTLNLNWAIAYSCEMVMSNFPFDSHTCRMCFVLNQLTPDEATFQISPYYDATRMSGKVNNEWALISLNAELVIEYYGTAIYFDCNIVRHPTFWVQLVIIPAYFLGVIIITGLFLGDEENLDTAVNYGLAVMMSITVIIGILADGLPKSSSLPVLGYFVLGQLIIVCVAVLFVVLRREVKKGIFFLVGYVHKKKIERGLLKGLIKQPHRSTTSRNLLRCLLFFVRVIRSNYLAFIVFQLMHALNLIFVLNAFNSEQYSQAMQNSAQDATLRAKEAYQKQYFG